MTQNHRAARGPPSPRRNGHRLRRCQTPPPRRHSLRAGALARDTRRLRRLPAHALTRGPPAAGTFLPGPSQSKAGTIHRRCRHSCPVRNRRRAVAHGHANASDTRGGGIPPLSCPLPTARLRGRPPVRSFLAPVGFLNSYVPSGPPPPFSAISVSYNALALSFSHHRGYTGEDDGERKGSVMKQTLYRLHREAGLSLASTAAGAAGEDSGSVRADVLSQHSQSRQSCQSCPSCQKPPKGAQ
jgi:hypothetical protein